MKLVSLTRAAAVVALLIPGSAMASSYTLSTDFSGPTEFASTTDGSVNFLATGVNASPLTLLKFDGSLGTLTGVELTLDIATTSDIVVTNNVPGPGTNTQRVTLNVDTFWVGDGIDFVPTAVRNLGGSFNSGFVTYNPGETKNFNGVTINDSLTLTETAGLDIWDFIGNGSDTFSINFASLTEQSFTGGGANLTVTYTTGAVLGAEVTYTYDASVIPLPAGAWLMIGGVGALGALRRRKKAAAAA